MSTKKLQILDSLIKEAQNADTLDGKHASEFAMASDVGQLQGLVGNATVSEQIEDAINKINYPVDSVNGKTGNIELRAADVGALPVDTIIPSIEGLATEEYVDGANSTHNTSSDAHTNMGWLTSEDEIADLPTAFDADTLNGHDSSYFAKQNDIDNAVLFTSQTLTEDRKTQARLNIGAASEADLTIERARINTFIALPEGSTQNDAELADIRVGYDGTEYTNAGESVRGQVKQIEADIALETNVYNSENHWIAKASNGHFYPIIVDKKHDFPIYNEIDGVIGVHDIVKGSGYIKCPKHLCVYFESTDSRAYFYFFNKDAEDNFVPNWDIVNTTTSSGSGSKKNYFGVNTGTGKPFTTHVIYDIPDGTYMRFLWDEAKPGKVEIYGWDGEMFGMPISADYSYPTLSGSEHTLESDGDYGVTIPGSAKCFVSKCTVGVLNGWRNGVATNIDSRSKFFGKLPDGYDFFRAKIIEKIDGNKVSRAEDLSDMMSIVVESESERASCRALKILDNCRKVCEKIRWTPQAKVRVNDQNAYYFQKGISYNGLPYCSNWKNAHYVGWHVSPYTFINAVADEESIFYKETIESDDGTLAPYYGLVCSAFATMCDGWPYPEVNGGMLYDPNVVMCRRHTPSIGSLYVSNSMSHVVIPERIDYFDDGSVCISAYESTSPVSQRTSRYSNVVNGEVEVGAYKTSSGNKYYDNYGYEAHHIKSVTDMSSVPYIGLSDEDLTIASGSAKPYKGDKCVYTSEEAVLINIKDTAAATLYLMKQGEEAQAIAINGAVQIDVKSYLNGDGIYFVYTDTDANQQSFEYHEVEPIFYNVVNGVPVLSSKDFWYVMFSMRGHPLMGTKTKGTCQLPADDYSYLIHDGYYCSAVSAVFRKGAYGYGAYTVPLVKDESLIVGE